MAFSFFFGFVFFFGVELRVGKLEGGRLVVRGQDRRKGEVVVVLVFELELMSVTTRTGRKEWCTVAEKVWVCRYIW